MDQFLKFYEKNIKKLKKQGIILPEAVQLIDSAGLEEKNKQIIFTVADYTKKDEMYEQIKNVLGKFFGVAAIMLICDEKG